MCLIFEGVIESHNPLLSHHRLVVSKEQVGETKRFVCMGEQIIYFRQNIPLSVVSESRGRWFHQINLNNIAYSLHLIKSTNFTKLVVMLFCHDKINQIFTYT